MKLYRKRFIPEEVVDISKDQVVYEDDEVLVTKWLPIRERDDIGSGISYVMKKEGIRINKMFDGEGTFLYWYCDMIDYKYHENTEEHYLIDLLADVVVYPNGKYEVLDLDELAEAYQKKLITAEMLCRSLQRVNHLLKKIKEGKFPPEICTKITS